MPLYLVSTPIGNLEDITLRALRTLKEVDLIACEDTRHTGRLLTHFGIQRPTVSYHDHNEQSRAIELVARLAAGESVAIVTDAGTPGISDPAYRVVVAAIEQGIQVVPIPGATALVAGVTASGLPTDAFLFAGFLPPKQMARRTRLLELKEQRATLVLYEAPHRIRETLRDALDVLGDRPAALARELTKLHEEFLRGSLATLVERTTQQETRGELTLVIAGSRNDNPAQVEDVPIQTQFAQLLAEGVSRNEAIKRVARARGIARREAYRQLIEEKEDEQ